MCGTALSVAYWHNCGEASLSVTAESAAQTNEMERQEYEEAEDEEREEEPGRVHPCSKCVIRGASAATL